MRKAARMLALFSTFFLFAGATRADTPGAIGPVAALQVNTTSADTYLQYHGRVFVKNPGGSLDEYRWGGSSCGTKVLNDAAVAALQGALNNKRVQIQPLHVPGQGSVLCLVGFEMVLKPYVKILPFP